MEVSKTKQKNESKKIRIETEKIIKESTLLNTMCNMIKEQTIENKYEPICIKIKNTGRFFFKIGKTHSLSTWGDCSGASVSGLATQSR